MKAPGPDAPKHNAMNGEKLYAELGKTAGGNFSHRRPIAHSPPCFDRLMMQRAVLLCLGPVQLHLCGALVDLVDLVVFVILSSSAANADVVVVTTTAPAVVAKIDATRSNADNIRTIVDLLALV